MFNKALVKNFFIGLPLIAILAWTALVASNQNAGQSYRVKIVGYDPFDVLSGHYLRFRYDFGPLVQCPSVSRSHDAFCACLENNDNGLLQATQFDLCQKIDDSCSQTVRGICEYQRFITGSERFYFPEEYAKVLPVVPPESLAEVKVQSNGALSIQNIYVNSLTLLEYAKMKLAGSQQ